ncbi:transcriptional regulator [Priestia endophytica]
MWKKKRTKFGHWLDKQKDINQIQLEKASQLSRGTVSRLCNSEGYIPKHSTLVQLNKGLKKLGKNKKIDEFL